MKWTYEEYPLSVEYILKADTVANDNSGSSTSKKSDYEETVSFVKVLLRPRHAFTGRNHEAAYSRMHVDLEKEGLILDMQVIQRKRRQLLDAYNRRKKNGKLEEWEFYKPLAVIQGLKDEEFLQGTIFSCDPNDTPLVDVTTFTKGAVWTHSAILYLISLYVKNKDEFSRDTMRQTTVWHQISKLMHEMKYYYDGSQCEAKMNSLKKAYRDEARRLEKTGAEANVKVPYFEEMVQVMGSDVTAHPPKTVAAGL